MYLNYGRSSVPATAPNRPQSCVPILEKPKKKKILKFQFSLLARECLLRRLGSLTVLHPKRTFQWIFPERLTELFV